MALVVFSGLVIYMSLQVGAVRCEVCVEFRGARACRSVEGTSERETSAAATNNVCAQLASGVTDSLACERTVPFRRLCTRL